MHARSLALVGCSLVGLVALTGCQPARGDGGGRADPAGTTRAERFDARVTPASLFEHSDAIAQQLASDLKNVPQLNGEYRATIVFGDIENKTGIVSTADFEAFRTRIRQRLMQSQNVLRNVRFVENRARMDDVLQREMSKSGDLLQEGKRVETKDFNPQYTYFLNGQMYRVERGGGTSNTYLLGYALVSADSREIIWENTPYEVKQVR